MISTLNLRLSALSLAVLALSGCSFIPTYERPAAPVAAEWSGVASVAAETPAADVAWTDFVSDARLRELIGLAIRNNRDLRVALGGVATTPWRARSVEQALIGKTLDDLGMTMGVFVASMPRWDDFRPQLGGNDDADRERFLAEMDQVVPWTGSHSED